MSDRPGLAMRIGVPLALATGGVLVTLVVLEVVLRATAAPPVKPPPDAFAPPGVRILTTADFTRHNVGGVMGGGVPFRTNAAGIRGPDYARPKPPGVFRIAVIGDSVTMGLGVREEETYAVRIERALNDPPSHVAYEVLNLGVAGFQAGLNVQRLESVGLSYEPDLILYGYTLNDIENRTYRRSVDVAQRHMSDLSREQTARRGLYMTTFFRTHFYSLRELVWPPRGSYIYELDDNYFHNPAAMTVLDRAFSRLNEIAQARGACVLVLQHTNLWFLRGIHPFRRFHAAVEKLAASHGFTNKDTVDYFRGRDGVALWVSPFDSHPNGEAHGILARAALDALAELPARCWGAPGPPASLAGPR